MTPASILIAAATRWEAQPLRQALKGDTRARVLQTGMGPVAASKALARVDLSRGEPALVLSAGFAGALQPGLKSGDLVVEQLTPCPQAAQALEAAALTLGLVPRCGRIQHSDTVLTEPADKLECGRRTGALAVDMESAAIRAWAQAHGLPALALRIIFDEVGTALPRSLPQSENPLRLGAFAVARPVLWPRLAALGLRQRRAAAALTSTIKAFLEAL